MATNISKLNALLEYVKSEGRVCPMPDKWNELYNMLLIYREEDSSREWKLSVPLILGVWWNAGACSKKSGLEEHIRFAQTRGLLDQVENFLRNLKPNQWAYGDGTTEYEEFCEK